MSNHTERSHARLSPSASKRWIECPGSVRMTEHMPNKTSAFADEGTAAHELAEHCLRTGFDASRFLGYFVNLEVEDAIRKISQQPIGDRTYEVTEEMADGVQQYLDFVNALVVDPDVEWESEQKVDLTHIDGMDSGTADFFSYHKKNKVLDLADLKYGRGVPVDPRENTQLLIYAVGVVKRMHNRGIAKVRLTIVQPRCPHPDGPVRTWECDPLELMEFEADLRGYAKRTFEADAPVKAGEWCKFCLAIATCPTKRAQALGIAKAEFSPIGELDLPIVSEMSSGALAEVLKEVDQLEEWCRRVKEHAHSEAVHGRMPTGFKLVAKRATRKWRDEGSVRDTLADTYGLSDEQIYVDPKLKSPAQLEPLLPGKNKGERSKRLEPFVTKESSGTVLAVESDPRPAVRADASEFGEA